MCLWYRKNNLYVSIYYLLQRMNKKHLQTLKVLFKAKVLRLATINWLSMFCLFAFTLWSEEVFFLSYEKGRCKIIPFSKYEGLFTNYFRTFRWVGSQQNVTISYFSCGSTFTQFVANFGKCHRYVFLAESAQIISYCISMGAHQNLLQCYIGWGSLGAHICIT